MGIGMTPKDQKTFNAAQKKVAQLSSKQRYKMLLAYMAAFANFTGWPVEEIELREFQKSPLEISYRFVTREKTDQHLVNKIRSILGSEMGGNEAERCVEKLAALHGVTKYD